MYICMCIYEQIYTYMYDMRKMKCMFMKGVTSWFSLIVFSMFFFSDSNMSSCSWASMSLKRSILDGDWLPTRKYLQHNSFRHSKIWTTSRGKKSTDYWTWWQIPLISALGKQKKEGGSLSLRPPWSTKWGPGKPELHRDTCLRSQNSSDLHVLWEKSISV